MANRKGEITKQLDAVYSAFDLVDEIGEEDNAFGLASLAEKLVKRRRKFDEPLGQALFQIYRYELWWWLKYKSFEDYCRKRLGISESAAMQRVRLERKLRELPPLREALQTGKLTYTKAVQVSRHATKHDVLERIEKAAETTFQKTKQEADEEERAKDRARGVRRIRGPDEAIDVIDEALEDVKAEAAKEGLEIDDEEASLRMGAFFKEKWEKPIRASQWRRKWEREAMLRHGGLCAVPGCSRAARHLHHIVFRSENGPHVPSNVCALCWAHHRLSIHRGTMTLKGRGGKYLVWVYKYRDPETGMLVPYEEWETKGYDEVRRRRPAGSSGSG
jgi:hypothetical protein